MPNFYDFRILSFVYDKIMWYEERRKEGIVIRRNRTKTIQSPTWFRVGDFIRNMNILLQKMHWNKHDKCVLLCILSFESDFCLSLYKNLNCSYRLFLSRIARSIGKRSYLFYLCVRCLCKWKSLQTLSYSGLIFVFRMKTVF